MRAIIIFLLATTIFWSCSSSSDDGAEKGTLPIDNKAPLPVTELLFPPNNMLCSDNVLEFQWEKAQDPNEDPLTYILEVATDDQFTEAAIFDSASNATTITLDKNQIYYWRVAAKDPFNLIGPHSKASKFYTEGFGETNHLPFMPDLVAPDTNEMVDEGIVKLDWTGGDVDGDPLAYDIYFDTKNPPENKIGSNESKSSIEVNVLPASTYFWRVRVKDGKGGEAIGHVWSFASN
ncbi:hypothetical protein SAMN05421766_11117 [Zobellia uliginosa]|uniref:Fibronectin type-III domain-containing protein n=1 Tax=Zobellia uliginosa TaxID=143224 RepID=A0ABY1L1M4_9FLAO|nr:hypothetical protein [Zobellia uliginosa]SIT11584.1 hypothetical protein SAMN05421766_11117 [Zobellia uliginosa]